MRVGSSPANPGASKVDRRTRQKIDKNDVRLANLEENTVKSVQVGNTAYSGPIHFVAGPGIALNVTRGSDGTVTVTITNTLAGG